METFPDTMVSYCHSSTWERATLDFSCKQDKIPPAIALWHHRDPRHKENLCPSTVQTWYNAMIAAQLRPTWTPKDSQACGLGRAEAGTSYIQNWNEIKDTLPQNCHASKSSSMILRGHHSPQYISTSQMSLGESSFSGEPQIPAHSSLATENIKIHYTHTCHGALIKPPSLLLKTQAIRLWNKFTELEVNKLKAALKKCGVGKGGAAQQEISNKILNSLKWADKSQHFLVGAVPTFHCLYAGEDNLLHTKNT